MAVIAIREVWTGPRKGNQDTTTVEYERNFQVQTDSFKDGPLTVLNAPGLPGLLEAYVEPNGTVDTTAFCSRREPTQDQNNGMIWLVRCFYTDDVTASPWTAPPEIEWGSVDYQQPIYQDLDGKAVVNSAGEMFDPPVTRDDSRPTLIVKRWEMADPGANIVKYKDAVNSDFFYGQAPLTVKVKSITTQQRDYGKFTLWRTTYTFHIRPETWRLKLLDAGYVELITLGGFALPFNLGKRAILDVTGHPVSRQWPLDGVGHAVQIDSTKPIWGQLSYLNFRLYNELPFAGLALGI